MQASHVWSQFYRLTKLGTNRSLDGWYSEVQFPHFGERDKVSRAWYGPKVLFVSILLGVLIARNQSNRVCLDSNLPWQICVKLNSTGLPAEIIFFVFYWWNFLKGHRTGHVFKVYLCFRLFQARGKCFYPDRTKDTNVFERFHDNFRDPMLQINQHGNLTLDSWRSYYDDRSRSSRWNFASRGECFGGGLHQNVSGEH